MFYYSLQQRRLASDRELADLRPAEPGEPDIALHLGTTVAAPEGTAPWYRAEIAIDKAGDDLVIRFEDGTSFLIRGDGRSIALIGAPAEYTSADLAAYALGPVLAVALHLQGAVLLHASAVVIREKALLFAGDSGSGKSTVAAMLHRLGYTVLADDVTEVVGTRALPSISALRLWPDVLEALYGSAAAFPQRAPSWDKKIVSAGAAEGGAREIGAILFLERGNGPRIEPVAPRDGWTRLMAGAYTGRLPDVAMARTIFEATTALAGCVQMHRFVPPRLEGASDIGRFLEESLR